jgi:hypothetical protein
MSGKQLACLIYTRIARKSVALLAAADTSSSHKSATPDSTFTKVHTQILVSGLAGLQTSRQHEYIHISDG